jgi:hypothetical protein
VLAGLVGCEQSGELRPAADVHLSVDVCEVELDRLRAEEQRRRDVAVRLPLGDLKRDL